MPVSDAKYIYPDIVLMLNGDLIIGSNNPSIMNRQFFGIKKNGRPYFKNQLDGKETYYYSLDVEKTKYQSYKFSVKINDIEDENEYIINIAKDNSYNLELYDFDNDYTYQQKHNNFFKNYQVYNVRASVINNISDFNNSYFILGMNGILSSNAYFLLIKMSFQSKDIINHNPILNITRKESFKTRISSCFETDNKYIICFYQDPSRQYVIQVYDHNLGDKANAIIANGFENEFTFYKSVHFHGEAGAFGYFYYTGTNYHFYIQFKCYDNSTNSVLSYFNSNNLIKIDKGGGLNETTFFNDMIKISDSKICFITFHTNQTRLYVILINNYYEEKIKIRYYTQDLLSLYTYRYISEF